MNRHANLLFAAVGAALMIAYAVAIMTALVSPDVHVDSQAFPVPSATPAPSAS